MKQTDRRKRNRTTVAYLSATQLEEQAAQQVEQAKRLPDDEPRQSALKAAAQLRTYAAMKRLLTLEQLDAGTADRGASHGGN